MWAVINAILVIFVVSVIAVVHVAINDAVEIISNAWYYYRYYKPLKEKGEIPEDMSYPVWRGWE